MTFSKAIGGIAAIALAVCFTACRKDAKLHELIEVNKVNCPMEITRQFTLTEIVDDGQYVEYRYVYADSLYNPAESQKKYGEKAMKETSLKALRDTPDAREFFDAVVEAGRGLKYVYIGQPSADTCLLVIDPEEIKAVADEKQ